jgi:hypothetical protein
LECGDLAPFFFALIRVICAKETRAPVETGNSGAENGVHLCRLLVFRRLKKFRKTDKKSLSALSAFNKRGAAMTNRPNPPFKKKFKKVKKKLVNALEIE